MSRFEHTTLDQAKQDIQKELEEEIYEQLRKIKKSVLEPVQGASLSFSLGSLELRKKYATMSAAEVVLAVFSNTEGVFTTRMAKVIPRFWLICIKEAFSVAVWEFWVVSFVFGDSG